MSLLQRFRDQVQLKHLFSSKDKLLLAVSGGVDSVVLCDLCKRSGYDFVIAHCNFKLRGEESDRDEQFVKELALKYEVPYFVKVFDTKSIASAARKSIEETARDLRYAWFHELLEAEKLYCILTAHHADDNIETSAMNFFRGTGIKGLRGMQAKNGKIARPLLFARKSELEEHARSGRLNFITDQTNQEDIYTRNFFRNRIIPMLSSVYPAVEQNLLHNLGRFAETEELYEQAIAAHTKSLVEKRGNEVHISALKLKKAVPLHTIVYEIIREFNFSPQQVQAVIALLESETGRYISSATHRILRNRAWLIISPLATEESLTLLIEQGVKEIRFSKGALCMEETKNEKPQTKNSNQEFLDLSALHFPLVLRKWKTGDYFYPLGMKKKKKIARFLIDLKLSKTEKEKVWVIESNKRICWVVGYRIDERFKITEKTKQVLSVRLDT